MKVSQRATYGIMAAIDLAMNGKEAPVQARAIARRQAIPIRFLEQVLHSMKKAGLVESLRGAQGGYLLLKEPAALSVADILEVLEGPVFHRAFQNDQPFDRSLSKQELLLGQVWKQVAQAEHEVLHRITIDELAGRQRAIEERRNPMYHI
jgi:Rrf2 family protein